MTLQQKIALFEQIRDPKYVLKETQSAKEILEVALSESGI